MTARPDEHEEAARAWLMRHIDGGCFGAHTGSVTDDDVSSLAASLRQAAAEERARIVATVHSHALKAAAMSVANGGDEDGKSYAAQRAHHALAIEELIRLAHHATPAAETKSAEAGPPEIECLLAGGARYGTVHRDTGVARPAMVVRRKTDEAGTCGACGGSGSVLAPCPEGFNWCDIGHQRPCPDCNGTSHALDGAGERSGGVVGNGRRG